jgi:perosamine synthetase
MNLRIPLAKPELTEADREAVMSVLRTPYLSSGPKVAEFERAICDYTGAAHAVAVNSGTSALQLAIRALGIERGAEVVVPSYTFSALLNVILLEGLRPRFVDITARTYNCSAESILRAITPETRLIIVVHTFGFPVDGTKILEGVERTSGGKRIHVIEDACEALGAEVDGRKAGTVGDAGLFAFYPNKQITTGEGGMLLTSDENLARRAARLRNQGRDPALGWNSQAEVGFSYRISDINCALGTSQLARMEAVMQKRQMLAETYDGVLAGISQIARPPLTSDIGRISWFVYPVQLEGEFSAEDRDRICQAMLKRGIATGRYFAPLHRQPVLRGLAKTVIPGEAESNREAHPVGSLANTEFLADRVIQLPFFNELTQSEIQEVCSALNDAIQQLKRRT